MADSLSVLVADGVVDEVISRLKSGKEADIYLVQHAGEIVAAKLYKDREFRSFKNNSAYKEGRVVRNSRTQRAMEKGSRFGQAAEEDAWKEKEYETLTRLFAAGMRVPKPYLFYEGVLLMEAVIDPEGHPAPRLIDAPITRERAAELYADVRAQVVKMLTCELIHGDLSPYNVLLAWNGPTVIDFPQVVGAAHNSQAEFFFTRDLETIRKFFAGIDPSLHANEGDAREIWRAYTRRELNVDFVPTGRAEPAPRRTFSPAAQPGRGGRDAPQGDRPAGRGGRFAQGGGSRGGHRQGPHVERVGQGSATPRDNRGGAPGRGPLVERVGHGGGTPRDNRGGQQQQRHGPQVERVGQNAITPRDNRGGQQQQRHGPQVERVATNGAPHLHPGPAGQPHGAASDSGSGGSSRPMRAPGPHSSPPSSQSVMPGGTQPAAAGAGESNGGEQRRRRRRRRPKNRGPQGAG